MADTSFKTKPYKVGARLIVQLPLAASKPLPSRGMVMAHGTINGTAFMSPLEPNGLGSHWFYVGESLAKAAKVKAGAPVQVVLTVAKEWPEPQVPAEVMKIINHYPAAAKMWQMITPMARWDWLRWINGTANADTRAKRIEVACSKMTHGERRPCCFNRNMCTDTAVSKSGVLIQPA